MRGGGCGVAYAVGVELPVALTLAENGEWLSSRSWCHVQVR